MKLIKKTVYGNRQNGRRRIQITLDEDQNVPDAKPDAGRVILCRGEVESEEIRRQGESIRLAGRLEAKILYGTDGEQDRLEELSVTIPFEEKTVMPESDERDLLFTDWAIEDLSVETIHSRKFRIQAVLQADVRSETIAAETLVVGVEPEGEELLTKTRKLSFTQTAVQRRELLRVREEAALAGNKPNIDALIWQDTRLAGCEIRAEEGKLILRGELFGFVMYRGEGENVPVQWNELQIPFEGETEVDGCLPEMIPDVALRLNRCDWEVREDEDGERRVLGMEAVLELVIHLYMESEEDVVSDLYSPNQEAALTGREGELSEILVRNGTHSRISEKMEIGDGNLMQICSGGGQVLVDEIRPGEDSLAVEGALRISMLYISSDDAHPLRSLHQTLPLRAQIEARGIGPDCRYQVRPRLEALNFLVLGSGEAEVRAEIAWETMVFREKKQMLLESVRFAPYDPEKLAAQAGIVCCLVQPGDTLWKIAKKYMTTVDQIREINPGLTGEPAPGTWLLIVKQTQPQPAPYVKTAGL